MSEKLDYCLARTAAALECINNREGEAVKGGKWFPRPPPNQKTKCTLDKESQ